MEKEKQIRKFKFKPSKDSFLKRIKQFLLEKAELTLLYCFVILLQAVTVRNMFGEFPNKYYDLFPFLRYVFNAPFIKFLSIPGVSFGISLLLAECIAIRNTLNISVLVRYHTLYLLVLELFQNLFYFIIDFMFTNEFYPHPISSEILQRGVWDIYIVFFLISVYSYLCGLFGKFPKFPGIFNKITTSIAFWFRIKKAKKDKKEEDKKN